MKIIGLIWLDEIIDKLDRKHHVNQREVVEIITNKPYFRFIEKGHRQGENVYAALGRPKTEGISLYFLSARKMDVLLFCQPEI